MQELDVFSRTSMRQRYRRTWNEDCQWVGDAGEKRQRLGCITHWEFCHHQSLRLEILLTVQHNGFGYIINPFIPCSILLWWPWPFYKPHFFLNNIYIFNLIWNIKSHGSCQEVGDELILIWDFGTVTRILCLPESKNETIDRG